MKAGKLNRKVTIEQPVTAQSTDGGHTESWAPFAASVWAAIEPLRGREWFEAGAEQSEVDTRIRIRYRGGVTASMRVAHKSRIFDIQYVADVRDQHRELHLMCKESEGGD